MMQEKIARALYERSYSEGNWDRLTRETKDHWLNEVDSLYIQTLLEFLPTVRPENPFVLGTFKDGVNATIKAIQEALEPQVDVEATRDLYNQAYKKGEQTGIKKVKDWIEANKEFVIAKGMLRVFNESWQSQMEEWQAP